MRSASECNAVECGAVERMRSACAVAFLISDRSAAAGRLGSLSAAAAASERASEQAPLLLPYPSSRFGLRPWLGPSVHVRVRLSVRVRPRPTIILSSSSVPRRRLRSSIRP